MKIVRATELIDGIPVVMGQETLEDSEADKFKIGEIIEQTRIIPGRSAVGSSIPIEGSIITTRKYKVTDVQERKSETGTPIRNVTLKEVT